jgi:2-polyprenyl-6-methoxyphenol hydroxylase-like FAD-dependent oxidoreductase
LVTDPAIETPVLIVGGGPVGLALAVDLGWRGVDCLLVEQGDGAIPTPKMNEINIRSMEFCRRWGVDSDVHNCPFPEDWPLDVVFVTAMGGWELARQKRPSRRDQAPTPFSPMSRQACAQTWFDPILRRRAESFPSVALRYRTRMDRFEQDADGVTAHLVDQDTGAETTVRSQYLAACDGAGSRVRRALGIGLEGPGVLGHPVHLFFRSPDLLARCGRETGTFFLAIDREGLWANIRAVDPADGYWRLMTLDSDGTLTPDTIPREALLRRALGFDLDVEWCGASVWTRRGNVAERYVDGRVFLVGDAAHQLSPTGALGMNTGLGDAVDLGWKLAAAVQGWGGAGLTASYHDERQPVGARNVDKATEFYLGHGAYDESFDAIEDDTPDGAALRDRIGKGLAHDVGQMLFSLGMQLGYRYEGSPIVVADGSDAPPDTADTYVPTARPGHRAPHVDLPEGGSTLDLFGHGFTLLRVGGGAPDGAALIRAADERGVPLEVATVTGDAMRDAFAARLVLVRPDGHVAWRGDHAPDDALAVIDTVRGAPPAG